MFDSIHLVGPAGTSAHAVVLKAIQQTCPDLPVRHSRELGEARAQPEAGLELLVLLAPQADEGSQAAAISNARGLPRWSVLVRGAASPEANGSFTSVPPEDWSVPVLAYALRAAAGSQALVRENARFRGDLRMIARRLAHDLRTPLNCLTTINEALRDSPAGSDISRSISDSVDEIGTLIGRLGPVLAATASPPALQPVAMGEVVWGMLQRLQLRIRNAGAIVSEPETWPTVEGVPAWIDLIWGNLLLNSLRHAGPQPRLTLGWETVGDQRRFWLRDSGPGVAPEKCAQLFHPLDRLAELNAPRGYGLPIVQRLVELQGGHCGYHPLPDGGASFFFTLQPHS